MNLNLLVFRTTSFCRTRRFIRCASTTSAAAQHQGGSLKQTDRTVFELIEREELRQSSGLQLIASENFCSSAVREALGSCLTNKYSEGYPRARYYGGNEFIDENELLCQKRALALFELDDDEWAVNVQALSGSLANLAVYMALLRPHVGRLMGLSLAHGGHLTHGHRGVRAGQRVTASSLFFESRSYDVDERTSLIDYDELERRATAFRPNLIVAGTSAYTRAIDYARMRRTCDSVGALLMADMAHIAGLVAAKQLDSPFRYADVVTTTTHKTLRGPRAALIFSRRAVKIHPPSSSSSSSLSEHGEQHGDNLKSLSTLIDSAIFPGLQGGPHNNTIAAVSVCLHEASQSAFVEYQRAVVANARALAAALAERRYVVLTGGTDTHLLLLDVARSRGIDGARVDLTLERALIACNRNAIVGDQRPLLPSGIRLGTPAITTRGLTSGDMRTVAELFDRGVAIAVAARQHQKENEDNQKLEKFREILHDESLPFYNEIVNLRKDVVSFVTMKR